MIFIGNPSINDNNVYDIYDILLYILLSEIKCEKNALLYMEKV